MNEAQRGHLLALLHARSEAHEAARQAQVTALTTPVAAPARADTFVTDETDGAVTESPRVRVAGRELFPAGDAIGRDANDAIRAANDTPIPHEPQGANGEQQPAAEPRDEMRVPLVPALDITPEEAVVLYPKPIHTQDLPHNRPPSGIYDNSRLRYLYRLSPYE